MNNKLSICIIGKGTQKYLHKCIDCASKVSSQIIYVGLDSEKQGVAKASDLGARVVDRNSLLSALRTEWVLFLKANEEIVLESKEVLESMLRDTSREGYLVYTKSDAAGDFIENYQLVQNLGQYKEIGDLGYVSALEPRLARKSNANSCLKWLITDGTEGKAYDDWHTADGFSLDLISKDLSKDTESQEDIEEHDKRCLKGDIRYGPVKEEGIDELGEGYIGFRVLHEGYLDGFMESAHRGFGIDRMYIPMLRYLNKNGYFEESRDLFEAWVNSRGGDKILDIYLIGADIYSHLFLLDKAISHYKKAVETYKDPSVYASIGKLYLMKGEKEKAVRFLDKSIKIQPDSFNEYVLSIINNKKWHPPILSLCMIAKDEEHTIGNAIESMKNIADEIIVVDTGSKDKTKEIAGNLGARVIEAQWNDDFSAVRNIALKEAHGDYAFILDSDEFIDVRDQLELAFFKHILPPGRKAAVRVKIERDKSFLSLSDRLLNKLLKQEPVDYQVRLFPRRDGIFFTNAAFESVDYSLRQENVKVKEAPLFKITHRKDNEKLRDERKLAAVNKSFSSIDNSLMALKGGLFSLRSEDLEHAYRWFENVGEADPVLIAKIAALYAHENFFARAEQILQRTLNYSPDSPDLHFALVKIYYKEERYAEVIDVLSKWIKDGSDNMDHKFAADTFYYYGIAVLEMGNIAEGIEHIAGAMEKEPLDLRYKVGGLYALAKSDQWDRFFEAADEIIHQEKIEIDFEINDFSDVGYLVLEILRHFAETGKQDEAAMCQKILANLVRTKMTNKEEIDKMRNLIEATNQAICA